MKGRFVKKSKINLKRAIKHSIAQEKKAKKDFLRSLEMQKRAQADAD
jgi:hypothetical protein